MSLLYSESSIDVTANADELQAMQVKIDKLKAKADNARDALDALVESRLTVTWSTRRCCRT